MKPINWGYATFVLVSSAWVIVCKETGWGIGVWFATILVSFLASIVFEFLINKTQGKNEPKTPN